MSYQALYRVFRPQLFEDVVGQEHITKTLQNALLQKKFSHAYLFSVLRRLFFPFPSVRKTDKRAKISFVKGHFATFS